MESWLKDLVFSSNLLEKDALIVLRNLVGRRVQLQGEQKEALRRIFFNLEEKRMTKEEFLEDLIIMVGYIELGKIVLELHHIMQATAKKGS